jgi:hypothetical protein
MTLDDVRTLIDTERAVLTPLADRTTSSFLKGQCETALSDLRVWEKYLFEGRMGNPASQLRVASIFLATIVSKRKAIEDVINQGSSKFLPDVSQRIEPR